MDTGSILSGVGKAFESQEVAKLGAESIKRDSEFLSGLSKLKTPELTDKITEHLVQEGRPGSPGYMEVFSKSTILDKELTLVESGKFDPKQIENLGLPVMIEVKNGQAILTPEAQADLSGSVNTLKHKIDQHIDKTAQKASEYYSHELTKENSPAENLKSVLDGKPEPGEIPFTPNDEEKTKLEELTGRTYATKEEAQQTIQKELGQMMRQRPGSIGLEASASTSKYLGEVAQNLGSNVEGTLDINAIRNLHGRLKGQGMEELQIYSGFGNAIEDSVERDFSSLTQPENNIIVAKPTEEPKEVLHGEVVYSQGEWLVDDIDESTKEFLENGGHGSIGQEFNPEEQERAKDAKGFANDIFNEARQQAQNNPALSEALKNVESSEDDREAMKLLFRIVVKVGIEAAVIIAKNIAKDKDTPQELRIALGIFADVAHNGSRWADKLITGEEKPDLENDCVDFIRSRFSSKKTENLP